MVKIRLSRLGKHKKPFYRIVAIDSRNKRDGGYLELLGTYEPFSGAANFNTEMVLKFLNNGSQPSNTVLNLLKQKGIWKTFISQKPIKVKAIKVKKAKVNIIKVKSTKVTVTKAKVKKEVK